MGWPHWKNVNFSTFWTSCFYSLDRLFFVLEYHEIHFLSLNCLKKNSQKWPFLDQNHRLTSLKKCQFFPFFNFLFLEPRNSFFRSRILKTHFPSLCCLKNQVRKMAIFGPKPCFNPFGKMSIFRLFELPVFIA